MRAFLGVGFMLPIITILTAGFSSAQEGLTKRDGRGPVTIAITLTAPPTVGAPIKARVVLDTHSVALDSIAFEAVVALRAPDGSDVAPVTVEDAKGGGHHREAVVVFAPLASSGPVRLVVKNVGGIAERAFAWELSPRR